MKNSNSAPKVILIGGTSNIGKSTLAQSLVEKLGWKHISTDSLARHPGRPWRIKPEAVPEHVAEHYLSLTGDELIESVLGHYRKLLPDIAELIRMHVTEISAERLILEGSALWPETFVTLGLEGVAAIWLTADDSLLQSRIYRESKFDEADSRSREMIGKFLERTRHYNCRMMAAVTRLELPFLNVEESTSLDELTDRCLRVLQVSACLP